jgi:CHAT domain
MTDKPVVARLLFLSANASDRSPLAVDREYNRVQDRLQTLGVGPAWHGAVKHVPAAAWEQVPEQLSLHAASIVHFAGHGHPDGSLEFSTQEGRPQRIHADGLARLFESYAGQVRLVVLNACYTDALAAALTRHIDAVIGMTHAISDEAALQFAPTFYQQLAFGMSVQKAFERARAVVLGHRPDPGASSNRDVAGREPGAGEALLRLRVRAGVDASRMRFAPLVVPEPRREPDRPSPEPGGWARVPALRGWIAGARRPVHHSCPRLPSARLPPQPGEAARVQELLQGMHARLLAGYAADAVLRAAAIAELALKIITGKEADASATLRDAIDELRRRRTTELVGDASWLLRRRDAVVGFTGEVRADLDDDGRRASEIAVRFALEAGLVTERDATACERAAGWQASEPSPGALVMLDRAAHRKVLDDRLTLPRRVLVLLVHGEIGQGHDHFGEIMAWRLRSGLKARWREVVVPWPAPSPSPGNRLALLFEELAYRLGVKLSSPPDDPVTPEGARAWIPALGPIFAAIDAHRGRLLVRHVLLRPGTGGGGDDALVEAYVRAIWARVEMRAGDRVVVGLDLRRIEHHGWPMTMGWRASRAELAAARSIATVVAGLDTPDGCRCITLPELTSVSASDLLDWLQAWAGHTPDAAKLEAGQLVSSTRGGRFDLVVQRLTALNLDRDRNAK